MASPFRHFRKYTGVFMVALCALLMLAFVVADPLMQYLGSAPGGGGPSRGANEVAVSWDGGQLTEGELGQLVARRELLSAFHNNVLGFGNEVARAAGTLDLQLSVAPLQLATTPQELVEQDVVLTKIYADAARDAGMAISDEVVLDYIRSLGRDNVGNEQLRFILDRITQGSRRRLSFEFFFDLMREALLARNFRQSYAYGLATVLPQQRYRDWLAVNDRVVVEAAAIKAEDYLADVPEPTDVELQDFFNQHKDRQPGPVSYGRVELPSPNPGFAAPRRVTLQYLRADYQAALDAAQEEVTDEEIAKYYEDNKEQFVKADDLLSGDSLGEDLFEDGNDASDGDSEASDDAPASEDPAEATGQEGPAEDPSDEPAQDKSSAAPRKSPFRLVALQDENDSEAEVASDPDSDPAADSEEETGEATDNAPEDKEEPEESAEKVDYQPLEEVSDDIRRQLAQQRAAVQLREVIDAVRSEIRKDYRKYFTQVVVNTPEGQTPEPPPESLVDLTPYAKEHDLEYSKVEDADGFAFRETELGKTFSDGGATANRPLVVVLFVDDADEIDNYSPIVTVSPSSFDLYIVQRLENQEPNTPGLDEVRDQVVAAWKRMKAAELALEAAEKKAEQAQQSGDTLVDFFRGDSGIEVVETAPFSRLTFGLLDQRTRQAPIQISQPAEISAAGPDFLEAVFEKDGVTATQNHDRSIAYVVRVVRHVESPPELRRGFLDEGGFWFGQQTMDRGHAQALGAAFRTDLVGEDGLDWKRPPDVVR